MFEFKPRSQPRAAFDGEDALQDYLNDLKRELQQRRERAKLHRSPLLTLAQFIGVCYEHAAWLGRKVTSNGPRSFTVFLTLAAVLIYFNAPEAMLGESARVRNVVRERVVFVGMWVLLGILSTVGLGTGLHTFILFLGPHIIRVVVTASVCESVDFSDRIVWFKSGEWMSVVGYDENSFQCPENTEKSVNVGILDIVLKITYPAILWGLGTAIGELPPYFIARAAAIAGEKLADLEVDDERKKDSLMERAKEYVFRYIQEYGFVAIMLFASIPNPLFDLAGLSCGHFGVPFWTFFGATVVGKALIKTTLQSFVYTLMFHRATLEGIQTTLRQWGVTPLADGIQWMFSKVAASITKGCHSRLRSNIDECHACCDHMLSQHERLRDDCFAKCGSRAVESTDWAGLLWTLFIVGMISFFVVSIIHFTVADRMAHADNAWLEAHVGDLRRAGRVRSTPSSSSRRRRTRQLSDLVVAGEDDGMARTGFSTRASEEEEEEDDEVHRLARPSGRRLTPQPSPIGDEEDSEASGRGGPRGRKLRAARAQSRTPAGARRPKRGTSAVSDLGDRNGLSSDSEEEQGEEGHAEREPRGGAAAGRPRRGSRSKVSPATASQSRRRRPASRTSGGRQLRSSTKK